MMSSNTNKSDEINTNDNDYDEINHNEVEPYINNAKSCLIM